MGNAFRMNLYNAMNEPAEGARFGSSHGSHGHSANAPSVARNRRESSINIACRITLRRNFLGAEKAYRSGRVHYKADRQLTYISA